ncbi:fibrobacter succinogenes major paralogous domain-containing protein [Candidatus Desantisbacteria bacterium]|nr:fibrobacter succinogenes major paralogous domain-containing protein [Candidatus Desantisbacteria bacterium]
MEKLIDVVQIGNQIWTTKNLSTTKFNDGTVIPNVIDDEQWSKLTTPGYCFYYNTTDVKAQKKYGVLYNWYALEKLAPAGWHIPTDAEWQTLSDYLREDAIARGKINEAGNWQLSDVGAINESGFSALLSGYRQINGYFTNQSYSDNWWSATMSDASVAYAYYRTTSHYPDYLPRYCINKTCGFSIRLVKD